jgi:phage FluMu gp28-like protein
MREADQSPTTDDRLEPYRRALPKNEIAALDAWLSTLYPFQLKWLLEPADLACSVKSRQIGLSHTTGAVGVLWGAFRGELTTIISKGELESTEVLHKAKLHAFVLESLGSKMAVTTRSSGTEISFASGGRILALPSSGGRGFTGNVFLDEFAYQEHASQVWDAAAAVTMLGGKLRVASTPNGMGGEFYELIDRTKGGETAWAYHEIPLSLARAQGYPVDEAKCKELAKGDPRLWEQMFNCSFIDGNMQYIPSDYVTRCCADDLSAPNGEYYGGLDIGRENDLTVLMVVRYVSVKVGKESRSVRVVVHVEFMKRTDSDGLEAMVDRAFARFKLRRLCIDATGLGTFPAERIQKKHSERVMTSWRRPRVECIQFTPTMKETLATGLYASLTSESVKLPRTDASLPGCPPGSAEDIRKAITSIRRVVTQSGNVTYDAPRTSKGHADHAWSLALALHACSTVNPMIEALSA